MSNRFGYPGLISCTIRPMGDTQEVANQIPAVIEFDLDQFARKMVNITSHSWSFQYECVITGVTLHPLNDGPVIHEIPLTDSVRVGAFGSLGISQGGINLPSEMFGLIQAANDAAQIYIIDEVPI